MERGVRMAVHVTIQTGDTKSGFFYFAVFRLVELLLWKRRQQQTHPFHLNRRDLSVENLVIVFDRKNLPLRNVAQVGPAGQEHRRRELGSEMVRQVELDVE